MNGGPYHARKDTAKPVATDNLVAAADQRQRAPWTTPQLERVRDTAAALVKTHHAHDLPDKRILTTVDGRAFWSLLGALSRTQPGDDDD